jgi:ParB-like chromosome segregation protein Spo0J
MAGEVNVAFEPRVIVLPLASILRLRRISPGLKQTIKYRRIRASIAEIGIVEPLMIAAPTTTGGSYLLLDGHLRHEAMTELGMSEARCIVARDDEAFTYNKRVSHLATVQQHYMIMRALENGVSEAKLARALNVDIATIKHRRTMLEGVCNEVIEQLKDRSINPSVFDALRKMRPDRQIEAVELMATAENFTATYARALLAATPQQNLSRPDRPMRVAGITPEQMARMEQEMEGLHGSLKALEASYGDDVLSLVIAGKYIGKLIGNLAIARYLKQHYPEILTEFEAIVAAASLDEGEVEQGQRGPYLGVSYGARPTARVRRSFEPLLITR